MPPQTFAKSVDLKTNVDKKNGNLTRLIMKIAFLLVDTIIKTRQYGCYYPIAHKRNTQLRMQLPISELIATPNIY